MAMASSSLQEYPFLTWTSGGNLGSASLPLVLFGSGAQLEYCFHLFRFFGKSACEWRKGHENPGVGPRKRERGGGG